MNYKEGKRLLEQKVEDFSSNRDEYLSHTFHEASARARFIDPFFIALGWNFEQTHLKINQWDVLREYSDHSTTKRPDYAFRINGELKFFVEAKAPHVHLTNKEPVFQAKRYAFSTNGKAPIVILTDFEEFRVINALKKPNINLPLEGVLKQYDLTYDKYLTKWDLLYDHFSKEAVTDGSLEELKGKLTKKTKTLDREFLEEITQWREMLARNIALRNHDLSVDELNVSVQRILDRLIFIRNLEDRRIEAEGKLLSIGESKTDIYSKLVPLFRKLDREYNGLLFKQHFSEKLVLDDKVLIHIIKHLSWPLSPYQFDVIEPEILGRIYEKFLGSKIRLTAGHHAKVEEKPEVRKAGGVYYTPQYIVDYIVKHTVGEKVKGKAPEEIVEIKIVDPACGSGSFLLGAFEYLMNYHLDWYGRNRRKRRYKDDWYETADGEIRLSVRKKADILKKNIYGVDIDREATEVATMSLYLKLLDEGFDKGQAMLFMKGHILPDMSRNIKCGNSLIGSDYFDGMNLSLFDDDEAVKKVNAFDWDVEFPEVFAKDGFDCVIGNPPYGAMFEKYQITYLKNKYNCFADSLDSYFAFTEQSHSILSEKGLFGFIIPSAFMGGPRFKQTRIYLLGYCIEKLILPPFDVFKDAYIDTAVLITKNVNPKKSHSIVVYEYPKKEKIKSIELKTPKKIKQDEWKITIDNKFVIDIGMAKIIRKLSQGFISTIGENIEMVRGVLFDRGLLTNKKINENSFSYFEGDIYRFILNYKAPKWIEYGTKLKEYPRSPGWFSGKRILLRRLVNRRQRLMASFFDKPLMTNKNLYIIKSNRPESLNYFLGLFNSLLFSRIYLTLVSQARKDDFPQVTIKDFKRIPFRQIDFENKNDKTLHDQMVAFVDTILELNKKLPKVKTEHEKTVIQRQIDATDRKIDKLVYKLYDLTEEEIRTVEESIARK